MPTSPGTGSRLLPRCCEQGRFSWGSALGEKGHGGQPGQGGDTTGHAEALLFPQHRGLSKTEHQAGPDLACRGGCSLDSAPRARSHLRAPECLESRCLCPGAFLSPDPLPPGGAWPGPLSSTPCPHPRAHSASSSGNLAPTTCSAPLWAPGLSRVPAPISLTLTLSTRSSEPRSPVLLWNLGLHCSMDRGDELGAAGRWGGLQV